MNIIAGMDLSRAKRGHATLDVDPGLTPTILPVNERVLERECLVFRLNVAEFQLVAAMSAENW